MDVLGKLCTLEGNDEVIEGGLEPEAYQSLIKVLIVSDVQVMYETKKKNIIGLVTKKVFNKMVFEAIVCLFLKSSSVLARKPLTYLEYTTCDKQNGGPLIFLL